MTTPTPPDARRDRLLRYDNVFEVMLRILIAGVIAFLYLPLVPL